MNLVTSLGMQAMMHLGEIPHPETNQPEEDLQAAREMIELLMALQEKTRGGLSLQEDKTLSGLVSELQIKFSQKA
ncbi:MAG: hypothetical protein A2Z83_08950 [Omnitrophica bacterium GWA2_52_8]|nr:MAG: hypothetical protein A2Z83_08950 [Omnitrophica bacterium GWA2_52_8]